MSAHDNWMNNPFLGAVWVAIGVPGFAGAEKARRQQLLDERFGVGGWRYGHYVRGEILSPHLAILLSPSRGHHEGSGCERPTRHGAPGSGSARPRHPYPGGECPTS